jgi:hypothetical protein
VDLRADRDTILQAFDLFVAAGDVVELRAPLRRGRTLAGYFDDRERFATEAIGLSGRVQGVYWTENPVKPALLGRACNRIGDYATNLTGDGDILRRRRIPFDLDATRPAGISATDEEHALALAAVDRTVAFLVDHGVPAESLLDNDSGNGGHLHLLVDLPNDAVATTLVRMILAVVAAHVDTDRVHVDQMMFNASRIVKVPGTLAAKGDSLPERPHRLATFRTIPARWTPVDTAVLQTIAALHRPDPPPSHERRTGTRGAFDVRAFLAAHAVTITREKPWQGTQGRGTFLELAACVFDARHDRGEAGVVLLDSGMLLYTCHHNSCRTRVWADVRTQLEPRRTQARQRPSEASEPPPADAEPGTDDQQANGHDTAWAHALPAPEFCAKVDEVADWLVPGVLMPGAVTRINSPRGIGKTNAGLSYAVTLARVGKSVLLFDRDNPSHLIRNRLRAWGGDVLAPIEVLSREHAPALTEPRAWKDFPIGKYDVVVLDSWDASTEGVGEQDSAKPSLAQKTLLDLAHRANGPAILVLANTTKSGEAGRGAGTIEDREDIVFEVRDATGVAFTGRPEWWLDLPDASRGAWGERAARRQKRERLRLAFVYSKFRVGIEPDPFALEIDFTTTPWTVREITEDIIAAGQATAAAAAAQAADWVATAMEKLRQEVKGRAAAGEEPYHKKTAARFLTVCGLTWKQANEAIATGTGTHWRLEELLTRGHPLVLVPMNPSPPRSRTSDSETPAAQGPADSRPRTPAPGADVPERPNGTPSAARDSESRVLEHGGEEKTPFASVADVLDVFPGAREATVEVAASPPPLSRKEGM